MKNLKYWSGTKIEKLDINDVFLYGSNVLGVNGAGGARAAMLLGKFGGAKNGVAHGFNGSNTYALLTKILPGQEGVKDPINGFVYNKTGYQSVSTSQIRDNIKNLYNIARLDEHKEKSFLISYQYESWPNGSPKKSLNGYTSKEMLEMFVKDQDVPDNIVFHDSYKPHIEKILSQNTKPTPASKVVAPQNGEIPQEIAFTKVALPFGWMGNMAPYPVVYEGKEYKTTESLFQVLRFVGFENVQNEIMAEKSPISAKMVAKKYKHLLEENGYELMGEKDVENMRLCVKLKLEQHPELAKQLIETGNSLIIEDCSSRPQGSGVFWGASLENNQWVGKNVLGEVLMDFREKLQNNKELEVKTDKIVNTPVTMQIAKPEYTFFFQATSPFSQWHPSLFTYKELDFICTEQFMMYAKAKTFKDDVVADKIMHIENCFKKADGTFATKDDEACYNLVVSFREGKINNKQIVNNYNTLNTWKKVQGVIKKLGREVSNYNEAVWVAKRVNVVSVANREKYNQNPELYTELMNTGDTMMCEASPYDAIWGIKLDEATARKTDPSKWPGLNLLGGVLTDLKAYYRNELSNTSKMKM